MEANAGVPTSVVKRAIALRDQAEIESRTRRDASLLFDEAWCLFDKDDHPHLPDAISEASRHGINVALSNPSFELWLLLHFQKQTAHILRHLVRRKVKAHLAEYDKRIDQKLFARLKDKFAMAVERARDLEQWHVARKTSGQNPSTGVFRLGERLEVISRPLYR